MIKSVLKASVAASALLVAACGTPSETVSEEKAATEQMQEASVQKAVLGDFGIELSNRNESVTPGDDFFMYANGTWYDAYEMPEDKSVYGSFYELHDQSQEQVKAIIEEVASAGGADGTAEQMVGDYYASFMDTDTLNALGIKPLMPTLEAIDGISDKAGLTEVFGRSVLEDTVSPFYGGIGINRLNPDQYQYTMSAAGLGLPDRDYYLDDTERFTKIRAAYVAHIAEMLAFADEADAAAKAEAILALETKIAEAHWPRADRRNRDKTLNPIAADQMAEEYAGFDWNAFFAASGFAVNELNVSHPSAVKDIVALINSEDLDTWKAYVKYHTISNAAPLLSEEIYAANFKFYGTELGGQPKPRERWKRGVSLLSGTESLGEALGQIYVKQHFPAEAKAQMEELVENLRLALGQRINDLEWMGAETKEKAQEKLAAFNPKIAYPNKWRSYDGLEIKAGDLFGNRARVREFFHAVDAARLGRPTDRDEWFMTPQTVNAYYNPQFNEIVFPAAILKPPFFDPNADAAVNYGAIGAVIGHEMGHGFDDQGSKSDAKGVQTNWWTDEDRARFEERTKMLVDQYSAYEPIEGNFVDGNFTLGENIGDVGGLAMAYHAYKISLGGKEAPVINGLTGDQRFFLSWAQVWRSKVREATLLQRLKSDPHAPDMIRAQAVRNHDAWYEAFGVKEGDKLYLKPEDRVRIW
ncbi:peptidase M13 [Kordiimonas sediminis]|uniref:Peptidase M13 n=1 Tax=Kordiimonas sediminis TaxID=1735581 RepID=A0A919E4F2_9PROT|nr:M13-type metalloendopeptidase [Kordiimonas sediminis]GHF11184.1 peptidase M13 [Kordiimonas sediminis]